MNITVERLQQIEAEREATISNSAFIEWMQKLNVSRSYTDPTGRLNGAELTSQYDYKKYQIKVASLI
jgi:hypothetical protein